MTRRRLIYLQLVLLGAFVAGLSTAFLDVDRDHFSPVAEALFGVGVWAGPVLLLTGLLLLIFDIRAARRRYGAATVERTARWTATGGWTLTALALAWIPTFIGAAVSLRLPEPECAEKFCIRFADVVLIGGGIIAAVELVLGATLLAVAWLATREPGRRGAPWWLSAFTVSVLWLAALGYAIEAFLN